MKIKRSYAVILLVLINLISLPLESEGWWKLYFTSPGIGHFTADRANPETGLESIINRAEKYFYGAFYDISSPRIIDALVKAKKRGVDIKLVTDGSTAHKHRKVQQIFGISGVEVVTIKRRGLMHNKFAITDGMYVWTGSYNATVNDTDKNNNNAIAIYSPDLAKIYINEFMEMFNDRIFGNRHEPGPFAEIQKKYYVNIEDTSINVYFSPEDNIERIILKRLAKAKVSIHFMAFSFTSDAIGEMMIKKHKEGVSVYGLFERKGARTKHSEYIKMKLEGMAVRLDRNRSNMHHKVIIIDGCRVITGSFNFSRNANKFNDENIMIIDNRDIAAEYLAEFKRLY